MKKYTPLDGLRWSRNSDSALNNMPQTDVLGRAGGGNRQENPRITLPARDTVTQRQWFVHNTVQTIGATVSD